MSNWLWLFTFIAGFLIYLAIASKTGFSVLTGADGKSRFKALGGILGSSNSDGVKGAIASWWSKVDDPSSPGQRTILFILALLLAYGEFSWRSTVWAALGLILVAAIVKPPKGMFTKAFLVLELVVLILASAFPGFAEMRKTGVEIAGLKFSQQSQKMTKYANELKNCVKDSRKCVDATNSPQLAAYQPQAKASLKTTTQVLSLVPGGGFKKIEIPPNAKVIEDITWDCPKNCILEVEHDGDRLCEIGSETEDDGGRVWYLGTYKGTRCRTTTIDASNNRYREQLLILPGMNGREIPNNLVRLITSFGTNEVLGPIEVSVKVSTSS